MILLESIRCSFGYHAEPVRDQAADGTRVLRCPRCFSYRGYPETDTTKLAALRAEQQRQAGRLQARHQWIAAIGTPAMRRENAR